MMQVCVGSISPNHASSPSNGKYLSSVNSIVQITNARLPFRNLCLSNSSDIAVRDICRPLLRILDFELVQTFWRWWSYDVHHVDCHVGIMHGHKTEDHDQIIQIGTSLTSGHCDWYHVGMMHEHIVYSHDTMADCEICVPPTRMWHTCRLRYWYHFFMLPVPQSCAQHHQQLSPIPLDREVTSHYSRMTCTIAFRAQTSISIDCYVGIQKLQHIPPRSVAVDIMLEWCMNTELIHMIRWWNLHTTLCPPTGILCAWATRCRLIISCSQYSNHLRNITNENFPFLRIRKLLHMFYINVRRVTIPSKAWLGTITSRISPASIISQTAPFS